MLTYSLPIFAPLVGFFLAGGLGSKFPRQFSQLATCLLMSLSVLGSFFIFYHVVVKGQDIHIPLMTWINIQGFCINWALFFDPLTSLMLLVVTLISLLVHIYSIEYMRHDPAASRFMAYLSLFTFMMLMLVSADNFVQLFFGWEGVGVASYLLIGFWSHKSSANAAALKAFIVNRVGDLGLILGISAIYYIFGTLEFKKVFQLIPVKNELYFFWGSFKIPCLEMICFCLFIGAMGKSAQLGLHTWLPDAMEGPTPVSALIHAATMVTAGVFLVAKCSPLYEQAENARHFITFIGATTAVFAGTIALTQHDIKRVIAYSTCSQLGYMFFAAGLSNYSMAIFHLVTHAFFKALLFLGAGAVIHALSEEQDMRAMGGMGRLIPVTYLMMIIGSLSLAGIPYFSGYYSKDAILETAFNNHSFCGSYAYYLGIGGAFLTAFYSCRLLFLTFTGQSRANEMVISHVHEPGLIMLIPLCFLTAGAIFVGYIGLPYFQSPNFWRQSLVILENNHAPLSLFLEFLPTIFAILGMIMAYFIYVRYPDLPKIISNKLKFIYKIFLNKWYFDELYEKIFIRSSLKLGEKFDRIGDSKMINGWGPDGITKLVLQISRTLSHLQTGQISHYAYAMGLGIAGLFAWLILFK